MVEYISFNVFRRNFLRKVHIHMFVNGKQNIVYYQNANSVSALYFSINALYFFINVLNSNTV